MPTSSLLESEKDSSIPLLVFNKAYRYWLLIQKYWWLILTLIVIGLLWKFYLLDKQPAEYLSTGRMMVRARFNLPEGVSYSEELANFFGTQLEIMRSPQIIELARKRVLEENEGISGGAQLTATQVPKTSIFALTARGDNAEYTRLFLDAVMDEFIGFKRDKRQETSFAAISQISEELSRLKREQEKQQNAIFDFKKKYNIAYWEAQADANAKYLSDLKSQEAKLKTQLKFVETLTLETDLKNITEETLVALSSTNVMEDLPVNETFRQEYFETQKLLLRAQVAKEDFLRVLKPQHPKVISIEEEINRLQSFVTLLLLQNIAAAKTNISVIKKELATMQISIAEWEERVLEASQIEAEYELLQLSLDRTKKLYSSLLASIQKIEVGENIIPETIQVLQTASPPFQAPLNWLQGLMQGALLGLGIGVIFLVIMDALNDKIVTVSEVEAAFNEPILSQIPFISAKKDTDDAVLKVDDIRLPYAEAYRNLRSSLIFRQEHKTLKTILVTSSFPSEGKSTIAANLAITMAQTGEKILLIDGDLRRGHLSKLFGCEKLKGLSEFIDGTEDWHPLALDTPHPGLKILPLGTLPSQPGEVFLRNSTDKLLAQAHEEFDRIIFDSAPVLAVTDSASLAPKVDGVIMVMRAELTSLEKAKQSLHTLQSRQANVIGIVVNGIHRFTPGYGYYKYKGYYKSYY